eukprot:CAMPEP_0185804404 /NCGR_PEP_ID=MMETSP1322-20130828/3230_1 /TAXON_ID=265543 /ORGANISM="Minutocellus polymorphus, Strain RCC2270" /LENGTH=382 /DNA_ID=CAMNT_0028500375 /DNA_START=70 /DNA_END=1218 /DNA_ORIENTATION=+
MTTVQIMMAGSAASVASRTSHDTRQSSSSFIDATDKDNVPSVTLADGEDDVVSTDATDKDNVPSVTLADGEDDDITFTLSTATFETRDDRPFSGCMSSIVHDVTDGWDRLEHNVNDWQHFDMPSCNTGGRLQTQTASCWIGSSSISCTVPVCSNGTSYGARTRGRKDSTYKYTVNLMDMYEHDDDDMWGGFGRHLKKSRSGVGVSRIRSGIAQVGSLGKKVSKPNMNIIKSVTNPLKLGLKGRGKSQQETRDGAERQSFTHAATVLSSIHQETTKFSNTVKIAADATSKIAADATSLVTSHATNAVGDYQQKMIDKNTKALATHTGAIGQRLIVAEQKIIQANEFLNQSHQRILDEAKRGDTADDCSCTVISEGPEGIEVVQ